MSARKKTLIDSSSKTANGADASNMKPFEVSHSKDKLARRCLKAYEYRYLRKLQKRVKSRPLIVGTLVHSCLEMYFRDGHYLPAIRDWKEGEFSKMFKEEQALHSDVIPLAKQLIRGYIRNWHDSGLEMVWVEKDFRIEVAPGIIFVGKIDGMAREKTRPKVRWLVEHKTCKKMPGEEVRIYDTQVLKYQAALRLLNEPDVAGVIWDYLRTKLPTRPQLLKSGGLSKAKSIDTTREVYKREIEKHGLDVRGYMDILEDLDSRRDQFYRQVRLPIRRDMGQVLLNEMVITANAMRELEDVYWGMASEGEPMERLLHPFTRNLTRDCSWCDYAPLCHAELRGEDTSYLLKHDYIVRVKHADQKEDPNVEVDTESS